MFQNAKLTVLDWEPVEITICNKNHPDVYLLALSKKEKTSVVTQTVFAPYQGTDSSYTSPLYFTQLLARFHMPQQREQRTGGMRGEAERETARKQKKERGTERAAERTRKGCDRTVQRGLARFSIPEC